jgi:hypothetical protein
MHLVHIRCKEICSSTSNCCLRFFLPRRIRLSYPQCTASAAYTKSTCLQQWRYIGLVFILQYLSATFLMLLLHLIDLFQAHALSLQEKTDVNKLADATEAEKRLKAKILQQKKTQDQSPALANSDLPREGSPATVMVSSAGTPMEVCIFAFLQIVLILDTSIDRPIHRGCQC